MRNLFQHTKIRNAEKLVSTDSNPYLICSDGGLRENIGGFGLIIQRHGEIVLDNKCRIPKIYENFSSHRCEGFGIISALSHLIQIQLYKEAKNQASPISSTIICDNLAIISTINRLHNTKPNLKTYYQPDADIIFTALPLLCHLRALKVNIEMKHVKGHQDKNGAQLDNEATLNVAAHNAATASLKLPRHNSLKLPETKANLSIDNKMVTAHATKNLRYAFHSIRVRKYFQDTNTYNNKLMDQIWWSIHGKAIINLTINARTSIQKYIHRRLPCNQREHKYYQYKSPFCRLCPEINECQHHILRCKNCAAQTKMRKNYILTMKSYLEHTSTNETTIRVLIHYLNA
jgi:hypothetical protein